MSQASSGYHTNNEDDEYFDEGSSALLIPEAVVKAIDKIMPSSDPLDGPEFNSVNYINSLFPTEQSLSNIDEVVAKLRCKIRFVDDQIRTAVRMQIGVGKVGRESLLDAQQMIKKLFLQTLEIKRKAEDAEENVKEITRDVKQLDCAKRNLTSTVTTLNHLHMLVGGESGVEKLRALTGRRQYGEIVMPLQGLQEVMKHFVDYIDIPQIKQLADEVNEIQTVLSKQITEDFHEALTGSNARNFIPTRRSLAEACLVVNILDPKVKHEILKWFVGVQLNEYIFLFNGCEDDGWLDKIDRRYTWFKKHLLKCEDKFGALFPPDWEVSERITIKFCQITRSELSKIMSKRAKEIDVKLLQYAIQRTSNLEQLLAVRFTGNTIYEESGLVTQLNRVDDKKAPKHEPGVSSKPSKSTNPFADDNVEEPESSTNVSDYISSPFHNIIGGCFLPYLYIYIESLDRNLYEMTEKFVLEFNYIFNNDQPLVTAAVQGVLPSCADLFIFYKKVLPQCHELSNGPLMLSLCKLFKKYLREYAVKILQNNLPKLGGNSSSSSISVSVASITRDLRDISSTSSLIQNFLKEGEVARFSKSDVARICCILTTAEYCLETTQQLEEKLKEKVEPSLENKINISREQDIFHGVVSNCIQLLVQDLEIVCEPVLSAMNRTQWQTLESVGDQSVYVTAFTSHLKTSIPVIKDGLSSTRKYFTQFCIRFANSLIPKIIQMLYKCKPLSAVGAEQLLLDTHILKTVLLDLPSIGSQVPRKASTSYTKVVLKGMSRGEMILKVVMAPTEPYTSFVDQFQKLLPESDIQEFQKVLEMKGLKAVEKNHLLLIFQSRNYPFATAPLPSSYSKHETSSIRKLNNITKNKVVVSNSE